MDSPEAHRIASSPSSPTVQESPFFSYLSNLSPIKSVKAVRFTQRFSEANLPPPPPVFTSPRMDPQRETSLLERGNTVAEGSVFYGQFDIQMNVGLDPCSEREMQSCSPSVCVDEYLVDPAEVEDCMNSVDLHLKPANDAPQALQSGFTGPKVTTKLDNVDDGKNTEIGGALCMTSSEQAEGDLSGNSLKMIETTGYQRDDERFDEVSDVMSENVNDLIGSDMYPACGAHHCECFLAQNAGATKDDWDCTLQSFPEPLQIVEAYEECDESSKPVSKGSSEDACQHQRGTRRHLQFGAAVACKSSDTGNSQSSCNPTNNTYNLRLPASLTNLESPVSSHIELRGASSILQPTSYSRTMTSRFPLCPAKAPETHPEMVGSIQNGGNSAISVPMPSGIGLHLNSIGKSKTVGCDAIANNKLDAYPSTQENLAPDGTHNLAKHSNSSSISTSVAGEISAHADDDDRRESQALAAASSATFQSTNSLKPPSASPDTELVEQQTTSSARRMSASEYTDRIEEFNQMSPKKKRKRATYTTESGGCKRCNCKRSKCLKLYCECFAAGVYCADSCACLYCLNKPEYEDTVLKTRKQIESRNPLAFAPKIVKRSTDTPANIVEDANRMTPSSARHKRGCNCKKSMCLKKYCECYQAKVGCSDGCRCEGCKNSFGPKAETVYKRAGSWEDPSHEKLDIAESRTDCIDVLKSRLPVRRHFTSPDSGITFLSCYAKSLNVQINAVNYDEKLITCNKVLEIASFDQELDCIKARGVDQFSPTWEGLADISHLTPLSHPHSRVASSSSLNSRDCAKVSQAQLHQGSNHQSSVGSLRRHTAPIRTVPQFGGSKAPHELGSDSALYDTMNDDDTPEVLKDSPTPTTAVKASSPNQKRVSPPHFRFEELRSSSSPGLTSGRKFILQAVPCFPPLTPYSDPKGSSSDQ